MTTVRVLCEKWRLGRVIAVAVTLLALSMPAVAQQAPQPAIDDRGGTTRSIGRPSSLCCTGGSRRPPKQQLAADTTVVPAGSGAVFVPAMTTGADEPETLVYQGTQRVGSAMNGRRIVLAPGSYVLRIGSSPLDQMMSIPVEVTAGNTTLVPVTWGGIAHRGRGQEQRSPSRYHTS